MTTAVATADVVQILGRAEGMLMARSDISDEEAFEVLRRASQRLNEKLADIAGEIVANERGPMGADLDGAAGTVPSRPAPSGARRSSAPL